MSTMMVVGAVQAVVVVTAVLQSTHPPWQAQACVNFKVSSEHSYSCWELWRHVYGWGLAQVLAGTASLGVGNTSNLLGTCSEGWVKHQEQPLSTPIHPRKLSVLRCPQAFTLTLAGLSLLTAREQAAD